MRSKLQKKVLQGAQQTLNKFNKELESSEHAIAIKETNFQVPPILADPKKLKVQLSEIQGRATQHHNPDYAALLNKVVPLRKEFPKTKDVSARKQIAKEEFDAWNQYLEVRKEQLPKPDYEIDQKDFSMIKEHFDRQKDRKTHGIKGEDLVEFHADFAKKFKFKIPLHPKNMQQMIHPHFGYLTNFKDKIFSFDDLMKVYNNQIVSSYERAIGQDLLGDELASLSYWLIQDS